MSTDVEDPPAQSAASLMSGILADLRLLVEQQFQLTRREIEVELRRRAAAAWLFSLGLGSLLLGVVVLCLTLAHLLHWATSPAGMDPAKLPLWACYAAVALPLVFIGGTLTHFGRATIALIHPSPNPATEIPRERTP